MPFANNVDSTRINNEVYRKGPARSAGMYLQTVLNISNDDQLAR